VFLVISVALWDGLYRSNW